MKVPWCSSKYIVLGVLAGGLVAGGLLLTRPRNEGKGNAGSESDTAGTERRIAPDDAVVPTPSRGPETVDLREETPRFPRIVEMVVTPGAAAGYDREHNFQPAVAIDREVGPFPSYRDAEGDWVLLPEYADESIPQVKLRFFELDPAGAEVPLDVDSISIVLDGEYNDKSYGVEGSGLQLAVGPEFKLCMLEWERKHEARFGRRVARFDVPKVATGEVHMIKIVFPPEAAVPTPTPIPTPSCLITGVVEGIPPEELAPGVEMRWLAGYNDGVRNRTVRLTPPNGEFQFRTRGEGSEFFICRAGENYARAYIRWVDCGRISIPADADILQSPEDMVPVTLEFGDGVLPPDVEAFFLFERQDSKLPIYWMLLKSTDRELPFNAVPGTYHARVRRRYGGPDLILGEIQVEKDAVIRFPQSGSGE